MEYVDDDNDRALLSGIRDRYYRPCIRLPQGIVGHFGDCEIYRAFEIYGEMACSCGLLHDLRYMRPSLARKVYPQFLRDDVRREVGGRPSGSGNRDECQSPDLAITDGETAIVWEFVEIDHESDWKLIRDVFGQMSADMMMADWVLIRDVFGDGSVNTTRDQSCNTST